MWAASIYERLLSFDRMERELADNCLHKLKSNLLPPTRLLAKIVAEGMEDHLLACMERMIETQFYKISVVRAWGWFISLLGSHILENRVLVNRMLKILERTFLDMDIEVRIASQVSWKAMIDIFLPPSTKNRLDQKIEEETPAWAMPNSVGGSQDPLVQLTSKRMKLLMTPLLGTMTIEKSAKSRNSCWKTFIYILQKLGCSVNKASVLQFMLVPMFESIFKSGRNNWNMWVWDSCMSLFEEYVSLKINDKPHRSILPIEGQPIKWLPWKLCHLEFLLRIFRSLWKCYVGDLTGSDNRKLCLKCALRIWRLVLKGLDMEVKDAAESSIEHQTAVHLILKLVNSISNEAVLLFESSHDKDLVFSVWFFLECLVVELKPLVLASSLYKLPINLGKVKGALVSPMADQTAAGPVGNDPSFMSCVQHEEMVTPIVYAAMIWLKLVANLGLHVRKNLEVLYVKNDDNWLLSVWRAFIEHRLGKQAESAIYISCHCEGVHQFVLCLLLFPFIICSFSKVKKISDETEDPILSNVPLTSEELELFTGNFNNVYNQRVCNSFFMSTHDSGLSLRVIGTSGGQECPVRIPDLDSSECSLFLNVQTHFAAIYGGVVACLVKDAHASLDGNARLPPSSPNGPPERDWMDQPSKLTDTLSLAARFLILVSEAHNTNAKNSSTIWRVCEALISLSSSLRTQHDICLFLQTLSKPLAKWLCAGSDPERHFARKPLLPQLDKFACSTQTNISPRACEIFMRPLDLDNSTDFIGSDSCGDGSILALASRFLILARGTQNDNLKLNADSISRVCESLVWFSNCLCTQHDTLAFMQALSKPLVKWFNASVFSEKATDIGNQMFLLEKIWCQLLACLQNCHPPISFDSGLLNYQAPLLVSAFQCPYKPIAEYTLLFWERTYGIKTSRLSYPPCLVPVLRDLQHKVKITLPGFLHTYVSRRGLKPHTKQQGREFHAARKEARTLNIVTEHGGRGHTNVTSVPGQAANRTDRTNIDPVSLCKTGVSDEKVGAIKKKSERERKLKCNVTEAHLSNCENRKQMAVECDRFQTIAMKQIQGKVHASQRNVGFDVMFNIPVQNTEVTKKKRGRPRKSRQQKYKPDVTGNVNVATQGNAISFLGSVQSDSDQCSDPCKNFRDHSAINCALDSDRCISNELAGQAKGNFEKVGRSRKTGRSQLKSLRSDFKTLGIRHLRNLRNAGGLRGGKDWRTTCEGTKELPKMFRRQNRQFKILENNELNIIQETDTIKQSGTDSSDIGTIDHALQENNLELQQCEHKTLSPLACSKVETSEKAHKFSKPPASESPFKVRALGGGTWSRVFGLARALKGTEDIIPFAHNASIASGSSEKNSDIRGRNNRRKSGTPKRIPSDMVREGIINTYPHGNILDQLKGPAGEQKMFTGKRLKDVDYQLFSKQGREDAKILAPMKKLRTGKEKCFIKRQNAHIQLEHGADPSHAAQGSQGDGTHWAGIGRQSQTLSCHGKSAKQNSLEQEHWYKEEIVFSANSYRPKDNQKGLQDRNEVSSEAQSEATQQDVERSGIPKADTQQHEGSAQLCQYLQSPEEKQAHHSHDQPCDPNVSSGTSLERCIERAVVNHPVATCEYACTANSKINQDSKKGLALLEEIGKEWSVCDILSEIAMSPKLEDLGRQDLINAKKLLVVLSQSIAKRKRLLSRRK
eukprot:Gb_29915 [translate_table: standard]